MPFQSSVKIEYKHFEYLFITFVLSTTQDICGKFTESWTIYKKRRQNFFPSNLNRHFEYFNAFKYHCFCFVNNQTFAINETTSSARPWESWRHPTTPVNIQPTRTVNWHWTGVKNRVTDTCWSSNRSTLEQEG